MSAHPKRDHEKPEPAEAAPDPGYGEWLAAEIAEGEAELDAGEGIPADVVWKALGLE